MGVARPAAVLAAALLLSPAAAEPLRLAVAGPEEVVAAAETMTCGGAGRGIDVPDMPPSAFRRDDGTVLLLAGNRANRVFEGPDLDRVRRAGCRPLLESANDPDPARFRGHEWLFALHSRDGRSVLGFVHNEFHGREHGHAPCALTNRRDYPCWYGAVTLVASDDGGRTFARPPAPGNVLIAPARRFEPGRKRTGAVVPKVVENPADGRVYALATVLDRDAGLPGGQCLFRGSGARTDDWEMWDGASFVAYDPSPYGCRGACTGRPGACAPVMDRNVLSVRYLPAARSFVAIHAEPGRIAYRLSPDLLRWGRPETLLETTLSPWRRAGDPAPNWYFSLLDPTSASRNFDTLEGRPFLYFVRFRLDGDRVVNGRRDVLRVPLRIEGGR